MDYAKLNRANKLKEQLDKFNTLQELFLRNKENKKIEFLCEFFNKMGNIADTQTKEQMADEAYEFLSVYIDSKLKNFNNEFNEL